MVLRELLWLMVLLPLLSQICQGRCSLIWSSCLGLLCLWAMVPLLLMSEVSLGKSAAAFSHSRAIFFICFVFLYPFELL